MTKDKLLKVHGNKLQDCDFGIKRFNKTKRKLMPAEAATANRPSKKPPKNPPPPPPPPPPPAGIKVLYLDFTGHNVTGTAWNYNGDILCSPANLTAEQVDEVLANVVNEFAPYDVIVTTDEAVFLSAPITSRMRVIFTERWEWYGQAGGASFINSFGWADGTPCFVFTSLLNYNTKYIKEAAAHELGHTLGLLHQCVYDENCVKTSEYNYGNGIEAPIMGVGYYVPDSGSKWWVGPDPYGCNHIQDDHAILSQKLGLKTTI